ncbi:unnamed protein product, partial [Allacma fusca]
FPGVSQQSALAKPRLNSTGGINGIGGGGAKSPPKKVNSAATENQVNAAR